MSVSGKQNHLKKNDRNEDTSFHCCPFFEHFTILYKYSITLSGKDTVL